MNLKLKELWNFYNIIGGFYIVTRRIAGIPVIRPRRTNPTIHDSQNRRRTKFTRQQSGPEMGIHVHRP